MDLVEHIESLFVRYGGQSYEGARREGVSAREHALQCAQLAEWAHAGAPLVAAALLHDIGHFVDASAFDDGGDDAHELRALPLLAGGFGPEALEPIRLHVQAKRCLVTIDRGYGVTLSPASVYSLGLQGGPMSRDEADEFQQLPFASEALALRRWDDSAKVPGRPAQPLAYYLALLVDLRRRSFSDADLDFGSARAD